MKIDRKTTVDIRLPKKIMEALKLYAKTQLLVLAIVATTTWIILTLLGVKYALILASITGAFSAMPFFGIAISATVTALVAIFDGARFLPDMHPVFEGAVIIGIFLLMNQLMDFFLTPYLMSRTSNMHPLLIFAAVVVGTSVLGIPGTILAIPVLLVAKTILQHYTNTVTHTYEQ